MIVVEIVWQYQVKPQATGEFEAVYGPNGDWAQLFRHSPFYHGTQLLRQHGGDDLTNVPATYMTIDRWDSMAKFDAFKQHYAVEYATLDNRYEALTTSEAYLGVVEAVT